MSQGETMTPRDRAAEARRLSEAATPGPWGRGIGNDCRYVRDTAGRVVCKADSPDDGSLIAWCRNNIEAMAADVEGLEAEVEFRKGDLEACKHAVVWSLTVPDPDDWTGQLPDEPCSSINYLQHIRYHRWVKDQAATEFARIDAKWRAGWERDQEELATKDALIAELAKALEPFAAAVRSADGRPSRTGGIVWREHFVAARAALAKVVKP